MTMDKTLRNTFIGILATIIITFVGAWIQLNSRISVLEIQVDNFQRVQQENDKSIKELKDILVDIQIKVTHLQDTKAEK